MLNLYLENTSGHHSKFYHMIENKDGVTFTASWGRIGSQGRTQIYDMSEWDKSFPCANLLRHKYPLSIRINVMLSPSNKNV